MAVKLVTGLVTGSLAFVAEAVHSGTDLVAALLTLFAVRVAIRPPDRDHQYGHGKAEHLAALGESAFLILVSVAIAAESLRRLISGDGHGVEATWWAFVVLAVVIALDASRAVASRRAARRYRSPAFAANALHFALRPGRLGRGAGRADLRLRGRAVGRRRRGAVRRGPGGGRGAAAGAAVGRRADGPRRARGRASASARRSPSWSEPVELRRMRVRHAAGRYFADLVVAVPSDAGVTQAHAIADDVEARSCRSRCRAPTWSSTWSRASTTGDLRERATAAASSVPEVREVHNVRVMHLPDGYELSLHVKLPSELSLTEAHGVVERLESSIRAAIPELRNVHTHIEPLAGHRLGAAGPRSGDTDDRAPAIEETVRRVTGARPGRGLVPRRRGGPHRARDDHAPGRAAAALRPPARGRDRGGRARALPRRWAT